MSGCLHFDEGRRWISLSEMKSASAETYRPFTFYLRIEASLLAPEAVVALACRERGVSTKACSSVSTMPAPGSRVGSPDYKEQCPHSAWLSHSSPLAPLI